MQLVKPKFSRNLLSTCVYLDIEATGLEPKDEVVAIWHRGCGGGRAAGHARASAAQDHLAPHPAYPRHQSRRRGRSWPPPSARPCTAAPWSRTARALKPGLCAGCWPGTAGSTVAGRPGRTMWGSGHPMPAPMPPRVLAHTGGRRGHGGV